MKIYLDFDGTIVEHEYPKMGRMNFGCLEVIKKLQNAGHEFILNTYRADCNDGTLQQALDYLNNNVRFEISPITQHTKTKISPHPWDIKTAKERDFMHIDDIALHIPLKPCAMISGSMVDWDAMDKIFEENGLYSTI